MSTRRTIRRAREELEKLEAFAGLLEDSLRPKPAQEGGVIELEEVAPGVYASKPPPRRTGLQGFIDQVEAWDRRARAIRRGESWTR